MVKRVITTLVWLGLTLALISCSKEPLNNPYSDDVDDASIYYSDFSERPKTFDPARSYSSNEALFISQIYEPPLQYHYLKRPYTLEPLTAVSMPEVRYYNSKGKKVSASSSDIVESRYIIRIKPNIFYQPHPALAKNAQGEYLYHHLTTDVLENKHCISDFKYTGSRELTAEDYVYQIKRLAHPALHSPILGLMSEYIIGLGDYAKVLAAQYHERDEKKS